MLKNETMKKKLAHAEQETQRVREELLLDREAHV
jgi:hypothetical protein